MNSDPPDRIVKFTPRSPAGGPHPVPVRAPSGQDVPTESPEADDYRHRMTMNIAAGVVVTLLIAFGLWLAGEMAEFRAAQECLTMGARGTCAAIPVPPRNR